MFKKIDASIKALGICTNDLPCSDCPYQGTGNPERGVLCADLMMRDAIAVLRAFRYTLSQEPSMDERKRPGKKNRAVIMVDSFGNVMQEYASAEAAAEDVGTEANNIRQCCRGKNKTAAGHMWRYG